MKVLEKLLHDKNIKNLIESIGSNSNGLFCGVSEEVFPNLLYILDKKSYFVIMPTEKKAMDLAKTLDIYKLNADYLPPRDKVYYNLKIINDENMNDRLRVIRSLIYDQVDFVVMSLSTFLDENLRADTYKKHIIKFEPGKVFDLEELFSSLTESGYKRVSSIETKGEFSFRGGILDVFPPSSEEIFRVEFFDDEVDTIRKVDPETRLSTDFIDACEIFPALEIILDDEDKNKIKKQMEDEISGKNPEDTIKFKGLIEGLEEGLQGEREIFFAYLDADKRSYIYEDFRRPVIFYDPVYAHKEYKSKNEFFDFEYKNLFESGEVLNAGPIEKRPEDFYSLNLSATYIQYMNQELPVDLNAIEINLRDGQRYSRDYLELFKDAADLRDSGYDVSLVGSDKAKYDALIEAAEDLGIRYSGQEDDEENIKIYLAALKNGFINEDIKLAVFGDLNIFGASNKGRKKPKKKSSKLRLQDISKGDYVIHEEHGIGVYNGVATLEIKEVKKDYLEILYKGSDKLYVPVENINLIDKYMSKEGAKPKIYGLYSAQWKNTKLKSKKAIDEMARELIDLYAKRTSEIGYQFSKDTPWQRDFEDAFKYDETDGQLITTSQIKEDMESPHPMDRLLLGDVGYGKTEVAFRAVFKAIMDGKQVAMLAPTTLLAEQHTQTAMERFKSFPIRIGNLSRFRTSKQIKLTLEELAAGNIDFVIGTHRLLSKDVHFKDLGLLVIDEEQRFGVKHKEKIKEMSQGVDVLTLSATPIPRTLSMSLSGIRALSVIEEPPQNRLPVQTYVAQYNDSIIRSAILRELNRGGQVYFLYNDVKSQSRMLENLQELVPEARIQIANGQMPERQLEDIFIKFKEKEYDVLITSTIIETGMDIQNANTLIVYEADRLGLSTLYQLRGRVGRSEKLAYAYFTYKDESVLNEKAIKRLMAMKEFTDFGSGYKIAMRDLELRGAGNVLGLKQSGHMMEIGYELYMKYLNLAVKEIKGEEIVEEINTKVDLEVESALPENYLDDALIRMEIYKRIAVLSSLKDMDDWIDELVDRYNEVPKSLENLMYIGIIKNWASKVFIKSISQKGEWVRIEYEPTMLEKIDMQSFMENYKDDAVFDNVVPVLRLRVDNPLRDLIKFMKISFEGLEEK